MFALLITVLVVTYIAKRIWIFCQATMVLTVTIASIQSLANLYPGSWSSPEESGLDYALVTTWCCTSNDMVELGIRLHLEI